MGKRGRVLYVYIKNVKSNRLGSWAWVSGIWAKEWIKGLCCGFSYWDGLLITQRGGRLVFW